MEQFPLHIGDRAVPSIPAEVVRPRLFKAIQAAVGATEDPAAQERELAHWLRTLLEAGPREVTRREAVAETRRRAVREALARAVIRCRQRAGEWFLWHEPTEEWVSYLRRAVSQVAQGDAAVQARIQVGDQDQLEMATLLKHRLRQAWCGPAAAPETFRLDDWLAEIGFFRRELLEIGSWARYLLTIVRLYREGVAAPEARRQACRQILAKVQAQQALDSVIELIIYVDEQVMRREGETLAGPASPPLDRNLFPGLDPEAIFSLTRTALRHLAAPVLEPSARHRLAWLESRREMVSLKDLMLLVYAEIADRDPLPAAFEVLDALQDRGYPILHKDFRDEYRAWLVPLGRWQAFEACSLALTLDPATLQGEAGADLDQRQHLHEHRQKVLAELKDDAAAFYRGLNQPLPQTELIRPALRFAVAWQVARAIDTGQPLEEKTLAEGAAKLLPTPLLQLIRPRKGYELKRKGLLQEEIGREVRRYREALRRWQMQPVIASLYDERLLLRLAGCLALYRQAPELTAHVSTHTTVLDLPTVRMAQEKLAAGLGLNVAPLEMPLWHDWQAWLQDKLGWEALVMEMRQMAGTAARLEHLEKAARALGLELAGQLYRLVVARTRADEGQPRLPGDQTILEWLAAWYTPEMEALRTALDEEIGHDLQTQAREAVWAGYPLYIETKEELQALIKYHLDQVLQGQDLAAYARQQAITALPGQILPRLQNCRIPRALLPPGGLEALVLEVVRPRQPEVTEAFRELEESVLSLLPRTNCGSCGYPNCLAFARILVRGQAQPRQCVQSPPAITQQINDLLAARGRPAGPPGEPYELTPEEHRLLAQLLDPYTIALRQRIYQELEAGRGQDAIPVDLGKPSILQVGKSPDPEAFHRYLEDYLGFEAANRLSRTDRAFLIDYGEIRLQEEWRALEREFDWLHLATRPERSAAALAQDDPSVLARKAYQTRLFFSDLSPADQARLKSYRLQQFLPDFLENWEQNLLEHWKAGYRIEDWADFAQIAAKSYWHQEHTPAPGEIRRALIAQNLSATDLHKLAGAYLDTLAREQLQNLEKCRQRLETLWRCHEVETELDLDFMLRGLAAQVWTEFHNQPPYPQPPGEEEQARWITQQALIRFDAANLKIPGHLRCHWEAMSPRQQEILASDPEAASEELARLRTQREGLAWREMFTLRVPWLKAQLQTAVENLQREQKESERFFRKNLPRPTARTIRRVVRHRYWAGERQAEILLDKLHAVLAQKPDWLQALGEEALEQEIKQRLVNGAFLQPDSAAAPLIRTIDRAIRGRYAMDEKKLQAYLFLLARMEGNLDKLTALLREIRETSDIIEAAWLAFTEERIAQARVTPEELELPADAPIPLMVSRLPDKEPINRYLKEGLPRGEPRSLTSAYWELLTTLQFYVITAEPQESAEQILHHLQADNYDLAGLAEDALLASIKAQMHQRARLQERKISICTYVVANRLASRNRHLLRTELEFLHQKGTLLKEDTASAELRKGPICAARGVELGKVRNLLYYQIADFLREERTGSFARRIGQIIERLNEERRNTLDLFQQGRLHRLSAFYILRRFQKDEARVSFPDLCRFLTRYRPEVKAGLGSRLIEPVIAEVQDNLARYVESYQDALAAFPPAERFGGGIA